MPPKNRGSIFDLIIFNYIYILSKYISVQRVQRSRSTHYGPYFRNLPPPFTCLSHTAQCISWFLAFLSGPGFRRSFHPLPAVFPAQGWSGSRRSYPPVAGIYSVIIQVLPHKAVCSPHIPGLSPETTCYHVGIPPWLSPTQGVRATPTSTAESTK